MAALPRLMALALFLAGLSAVGLSAAGEGGWQGL